MRLRLIRNQIEPLRRRFGIVEVDRRVEFAGSNRHDRSDRFQSACRSETVADHRLGAIDFDLFRVRSENLSDRIDFAEISSQRRRRMGVDVIDLLF